MESIPIAVIHHRSSGRIRFKVAQKKRDSAYFDNARGSISGINGIDEVVVNPETSSILVLHHTEPSSIIEAVEARGVFVVRRANEPESPVYGTVTEVFNTVNRQVRSFTGGGFDVQGMAFLALIGVGVYQISRGNFTAPAWYTAFWYAMNIFLKSKDGTE